LPRPAPPAPAPRHCRARLWRRTAAQAPCARRTRRPRRRAAAPKAQAQTWEQGAAAYGGRDGSCRRRWPGGAVAAGRRSCGASPARERLRRRCRPRRRGRWSGRAAGSGPRVRRRLLPPLPLARAPAQGGWRAPVTRREGRLARRASSRAALGRAKRRRRRRPGRPRRPPAAGRQGGVVGCRGPPPRAARAATMTGRTKGLCSEGRATNRGGRGWGRDGRDGRWWAPNRPQQKGALYYSARLTLVSRRHGRCCARSNLAHLHSGQRRHQPQGATTYFRTYREAYGQPERGHGCLCLCF